MLDIKCCILSAYRFRRRHRFASALFLFSIILSAFALGEPVYMFNIIFMIL